MIGVFFAVCERNELRTLLEESFADTEFELDISLLLSNFIRAEVP